MDLADIIIEELLKVFQRKNIVISQDKIENFRKELKTIPGADTGEYSIDKDNKSTPE